MRRFILTLVLLFSLSSLAFTQSFDEELDFSSPPPETETTWVDNLTFEAQAGLAKFSFNGEFTNGDFGLGVKYHTPKAIIEPALVFNMNIDLSAATNETELHIGVMPQVTVLQSLSLGIYYDWWETGKGLRGWYRHNTGFMLNLVF